MTAKDGKILIQDTISDTLKHQNLSQHTAVPYEDVELITPVTTVRTINIVTIRHIVLTRLNLSVILSSLRDCEMFW